MGIFALERAGKGHAIQPIGTILVLQRSHVDQMGDECIFQGFRQHGAPVSVALPLPDDDQTLITKTKNDFEQDATLVRNRLTAVTPSTVPSPISSSLQMFQKDHPTARELAFLMMRFSQTKQHEQIASTVRTTLNKFSMTALRADDKESHDELFPNIQTYMHGCGSESPSSSEKSRTISILMCRSKSDI